MILTIIGNRPQLIKAAMVSKAFAANGIAEQLLYTYQHYDVNLFEKNCEELGLQFTNHKLVNKQPQSLHDYIYNIEVQVNASALADKKIKAVLVYGDTNSTVAGTLFAKKHHLKLIHVEAGERSYNNTMPEEHNRIATDYAADLLLCVNAKSKQNVANKIYQSKKLIVGDIMLDALLHFKNYDTAITVHKKVAALVNAKQPYIYFTLHRHANTTEVANINAILKMLGQLPYTVVWPMHPRLHSVKAKLSIPNNIIVTLPIAYIENIKIVTAAIAVITDSGGLQKEAYWLQKQCITLRADTEWTETLHHNWNTLYTGNNAKDIISILHKKINLTTWNIKQFGNAKAAYNITKAVKAYIQ